MNVKQGDLAIVTRSTAGNEGAVVEVLSFLGQDPIFEGRRWCAGRGPCWLVRSVGRPLQGLETKTSATLAFPEMPAPDAWLRPVSGLPVEEYDRIMESEPA